MIRTAIFDLDGTVADTLESLAFCSNQALAALKYPAVEKRALFKVFVGNGVDMLLRRLLKYLRLTGEGVSEEEAFRAALDGQGLDEEKVIELKRVYMELFKELCVYQVKPYEGLPEMLEGLKRRSVSLAVFTNKPDAQGVKVVETVYGKGYFNIIRGQREGYPKKPAPDGALLVAEQMGSLPEECIYLGDTNTDMQTGKAAGMYTVGVLWGFREKAELLESGADDIAEVPADVLRLVDNFNRH